MDKLNFKEGKWMTEINVGNFVHENLTPYEGDALSWLDQLKEQ